MRIRNSSSIVQGPLDQLGYVRRFSCDDQDYLAVSLASDFAVQRVLYNPGIDRVHFWDAWTRLDPCF
jgi:hypothetical protein